MIPRHPKKKFLGFRTGLKTFVVIEGFILVSSYLTYAACNKSQTTRKFFNDHWPLNHLLDFYYKVGEFNGTTVVKDYDQLTWSGKKQLESSK